MPMLERPGWAARVDAVDTALRSEAPPTRMLSGAITRPSRPGSDAIARVTRPRLANREEKGTVGILLVLSSSTADAGNTSPPR